MDILSIDLGTYSIKFLELFVDRKNVSLKRYTETTLDLVPIENGQTLSIVDLQYQAIKAYLTQRQFSEKIIINIPSEITTSRYLTLPVEKAKKAESMIPYQLDDNLPFPVIEAHYSSILYKQNKNTKAIINIIKRSDFDIFFNELNQKDILPNTLASQLFSTHTYLNLPSNIGIINNIPEKTYMLLDIGHQTTKAYLINDKSVMANHISGIAGSFINETISEMYNISLAEAVEYKHTNCFFLSENQYSEVDKDQQEFAKLMKQTITPLIHDINQWMLGFRIKNIDPIECIYVTGGTSNIKNITSFLSEELKIPTRLFMPFNFLKKQKLQIDNVISASGANALLQGLSNASKFTTLNFLKGEYSPTSSETIPIHSTAFLAFRVFVISMILIFAILIERTIVSSKMVTVDKDLRSRLKAKSLRLSRTDQNDRKKRPRRLLKTLTNRKKAIVQEVNTLMSALSINAMNPLIKINTMITPEMNIHINKFQNDDDRLQIILAGKKSKNLKDLQTRLKNDPFFQTADFNLNTKKKILTLTKMVEK